MVRIGTNDTMRFTIYYRYIYIDVDYRASCTFYLRRVIITSRSVHDEFGTFVPVLSLSIEFHSSGAAFVSAVDIPTKASAMASPALVSAVSAPS